MEESNRRLMVAASRNIWSAADELLEAVRGMALTIVVEMEEGG